MSHLQGGTNHTHYIAGHKDPLGEIRYTVDKPSVIGETFQALSLAAAGGREYRVGGTVVTLSSLSYNEGAR